MDPGLASLLAPLIGAVTTLILMYANYHYGSKARRPDDDNRGDQP